MRLPAPAFRLSLFALCAIASSAIAPPRLFGLPQNALARAQALFAKGDYPRVIYLLSPAALEGLRSKKAPAAEYLLAESYARTGRAEKALAIYQVAVKLYPRDIHLLMGLAELFREAGLNSRARPLYVRILERNPLDAEAHLGLARIDKNLGFLKRSLRHYSLAQDSGKPRADIWREEAEVLLSLNAFEAAKDAARRALGLSPSDRRTLFLMGRIARASGDIPAALHDLDEAAGISRPRPELLRARTLWLLEAGRVREAGRAARAILSSRPRDPLAHWVLAEIALRTGRLAAARANLKAAARFAAEGSFVSRSAKAALKNI